MPREDSNTIPYVFVELKSALQQYGDDVVTLPSQSRLVHMSVEISSTFLIAIALAML